MAWVFDPMAGEGGMTTWVDDPNVGSTSAILAPTLSNAGLLYAGNQTAFQPVSPSGVVDTSTQYTNAVLAPEWGVGDPKGGYQSRLLALLSKAAGLGGIPLNNAFLTQVAGMPAASLDQSYAERARDIMNATGLGGYAGQVLTPDVLNEAQQWTSNYAAMDKASDDSFWSDNLLGTALVGGAALGGMGLESLFGGAPAAQASAGSGGMFDGLFDGIGDFFSGLNPFSGPATPEYLGSGLRLGGGITDLSPIYGSPGLSVGSLSPAALDAFNSGIGLSALGGAASSPGFWDAAGSAAKSLFGGGGGILGGSNINGLGALLGGLLGSQNGSKQAGTIDTTVSPWGPAQPYLMNAFNQAGADLNSQRAFGTPLLSPATNELGKTIAGDYLDPNTNPYLKGSVEDALGLAKAGLGSAFQGNNYGSSAHQEWLGRTLANTALPYYSQNYQTERGRQLNAAGISPEFTSGTFGAMSGPTANFTNIVGRGFGSTTSQPYFTNPWGGALSGAMLGSQLPRFF